MFWRDLLLPVMISLTVVVSLRAVGNILVVAMLVTPAAAARLLTDRMPEMIGPSAGIGVLSGVLGLFISYHNDVAARGTIVLVATAILAIVWLPAPQHGFVATRLLRGHAAASETEALVLFESPEIQRRRVTEHGLAGPCQSSCDVSSHVRIRPALIAPLLAMAVAYLLTACGGGTPARDTGVTIEAISPTATAALQAIGGKPEPRAETPTIAQPSGGADVPTAEATAAATTASDATPGPAESPTSDPSAALAQAGRWIEVDVTRFLVRLMDGRTIVREVAPVAVGEQVDTGAYASTQTGVFHVFNKVEELAFDPPYNTYISHWVGFDPDKANGFHSFLKDKNGTVVDASTGPVSNGCIRTGAPDAIFAFAEIGMPVWVHS